MDDGKRVISNEMFEDLKGVITGSCIGAGLYGLPSFLLNRGKLSPEVIKSMKAVGCFVGSYRLSKMFFKYVADAPSLTEDGKSAVSGALSTLAGCLVDPSFASPLFVFWFFIRGLREQAPSEDAPYMKHAPMAFLVLSSWYTIPAGYKIPQEVHPAYYKFLESWVRACGVNPVYWRDPPRPGTDLSAGVHPGQSIPYFLFCRAFPTNFYLAAKYNLPFYLFQSFMQGPKFDFKTTALRYLRSVAFLANYVNTCWVLVLYVSRYITKGTITRNQTLWFSWVMPLWGLIESRRRQAELAGYISAHALTSIFLRLRLNGYLRNDKKNTLYFSLLLSLSAYSIFGSPREGSKLWKLVFGKKETEK